MMNVELFIALGATIFPFLIALAHLVRKSGETSRSLEVLQIGLNDLVQQHRDHCAYDADIQERIRTRLHELSNHVARLEGLVKALTTTTTAGGK